MVARFTRKSLTRYEFGTSTRPAPCIGKASPSNRSRGLRSGQIGFPGCGSRRTVLKNVISSAVFSERGGRLSPLCQLPTRRLSRPTRPPSPGFVTLWLDSPLLLVAWNGGILVSTELGVLCGRAGLSGARGCPVTPASGRLPRGSARHPGGRLPGTGPGALQPLGVCLQVPRRTASQRVLGSASCSPALASGPQQTTSRCLPATRSDELRVAALVGRYDSDRGPHVHGLSSFVPLWSLHHDPGGGGCFRTSRPSLWSLFSFQWTTVTVQEVFGFSLFRVICVVSISSLIHIFFPT